MRLRPLGDAAALTLLSSIRPGLSTFEAREVLRLARGNPLLLEELSPGGDASPSLRRSLEARLAHCPPEARAAMALLALLGRPAERGLLGCGVDSLVAAGLALPHGDLVSVRHALLAEAAIDGLGANDRSRLPS